MSEPPIELDGAQKAAMAALAERRPDIVEPSERDGGPHWAIVPARITHLSPEDEEGVRVAVEAFALVAPTLGPVPLHDLGQRVLALAERAAAGEPFLARDLAAALEGAELPEGFEISGRVERTLERLQAIAAGKGCGCHAKALPYRTLGEAPQLEETGKRKVSEEGYVRIFERELCCRICGTRWKVTEKIDYDRSLFSWRRL